MTRTRLLAAAGFAGLSLVAGAGLTGCSSVLNADDPLTSIDSIAGPQERAIRQVAYEKTDLAAVTEDPALKRGQSMYDAARYAEAEELYRGILRKFGTDFVTKVVGGGGAIGRGADRKSFEMYGSAVEERAQFMLGECLYMQGKFPAASEAYGVLVQRYPSTRYLDSVTRRQFIIARSWLGFSNKDLAAGGDIETAGYESATAVADPKTAPTPPSFFNASDKSKPTFDTVGRARQTLTNIWINDPTGPLADDALMLIANDHFRRRDYSEAARHYEILREQYPESPHLENAYLLEGRVRQASYDGPNYDDANLERAAQLKQRSLVELDLETETRGLLQRELNAIDDERIHRTWENVVFYRRRNKPKAVRLYCNQILNNYPESRYAKPAAEMLRTIAEEERGGGGWSWLKSAPNIPRPRGLRKDAQPLPARPRPVELPDSVVPPTPDRPTEPELDPRRFLESDPFPGQDQIAPPAGGSDGSSGSDFIQASFDAPQQTASADAIVDPNVQTLPTTNPFAEFMTPDTTNPTE